MLYAEDSIYSSNPALTSTLTNLADYQNIIIGTPVWWYTVPMPVYSFLDTYDLSGKNVMVFTTHEGSGLADAISVIRQQEPQAKVNSSGFQTRGGKCRQSVQCHQRVAERIGI